MSLGAELSLKFKHNAAIKRLRMCVCELGGVRLALKSSYKYKCSFFFCSLSLGHLTTILFFIFQEFTLKPVDLSKPEGSDTYQIPARGNWGD